MADRAGAARGVCDFCFDSISEHTATELRSCEMDLRAAEEAEEDWGDDICIF